MPNRIDWARQTLIPPIQRDLPPANLPNAGRGVLKELRSCSRTLHTEERERYPLGFSLSPYNVNADVDPLIVGRGAWRAPGFPRQLAFDGRTPSAPTALLLDLQSALE